MSDIADEIAEIAAGIVSRKPPRQSQRSRLFVAGEVAAVAAAERSVAHADRSGDETWMMVRLRDPSPARCTPQAGAMRPRAFSPTPSEGRGSGSPLARCSIPCGAIRM